MAESVHECLAVDDCDGLLMPDDHDSHDPLGDYAACPDAGFLSERVTDDLSFGIPGLEEETAVLDEHDPKHESPLCTPRGDHDHSLTEHSHGILAPSGHLPFPGARCSAMHSSYSSYAEPSPLRESCRRGQGMNPSTSDGLESTFICAPATSDVVPHNGTATPTQSAPPKQCPTPTVDQPTQNAAPPAPRSKACGLCAEILPLTEFQLSRRTASGPLAYGTYCGDCNVLRSKHKNVRIAHLRHLLATGKISKDSIRDTRVKAEGPVPAAPAEQAEPKRPCFLCGKLMDASKFPQLGRDPISARHGICCSSCDSVLRRAFPAPLHELRAACMNGTADDLVASIAPQEAKIGRGAITAPCDVCNTHRPVAEVVSVKETCSETPADLPVNRVSSPHNNANENNVEAKAQPWGTSSNRPAPNAGTDGESDSMLDTHAISGREERDSAGERLQEGKEQSADVDEVVMGEQDLSDKGDHVPEERTLTTGVKGTEERPTNDTVLQGPLDVELEELKLEDTEVAGSQRSASDASDDEDLQPKLSLAELRTITLANSLAGLPPDAPVDWQEWGLSSKDTASLEKLNGTVRAHCGTAGQTSGGSGDDQTNWKVCAGCRRLKKSWGGTFEDLKAAIAEGAVMVSHVNASDGSKSDPYSKWSADTEALEVVLKHPSELNHAAANELQAVMKSRPGPDIAPTLSQVFQHSTGSRDGNTKRSKKSAGALNGKSEQIHTSTMRKSDLCNSGVKKKDVERSPRCKRSARVSKRAAAEDKPRVTAYMADLDDGEDDELMGQGPREEHRNGTKACKLCAVERSQQEFMRPGGARSPYCVPCDHVRRMCVRCGVTVQQLRALAQLRVAHVFLDILAQRTLHESRKSSESTRRRVLECRQAMAKAAGPKPGAKAHVKALEDAFSKWHPGTALPPGERLDLDMRILDPDAVDFPATPTKECTLCREVHDEDSFRLNRRGRREPYCSSCEKLRSQASAVGLSMRDLRTAASSGKDLTAIIAQHGVDAGKAPTFTAPATPPAHLSPSRPSSLRNGKNCPTASQPDSKGPAYSPSVSPSRHMMHTVSNEDAVEQYMMQTAPAPSQTAPCALCKHSFPVHKLGKDDGRGAHCGACRSVLEIASKQGLPSSTVRAAMHNGTLEGLLPGVKIPRPKGSEPEDLLPPPRAKRSVAVDAPKRDIFTAPMLSTSLPAHARKRQKLQKLQHLPSAAPKEALDAPPQSVKAPDASPAIVKPQITKSPSTRTAADVYAMYRLPNDADVGAIIPTPTDAPLDTPRRCGLCGDVYKLSFFKRNSGKLGYCTVCEKLRSRCSRAGVKVSTLRSAFELGGTQLTDLLRSHNVPWDTEADILAAVDMVESVNGTPSRDGSAPKPDAGPSTIHAGGPQGLAHVYAAGGVSQNGFANGLHRVSSGVAIPDVHTAAHARVSPLGLKPEAFTPMDIKDEFNPDHNQIKRMYESVDRTECLEAMPELDEMRPLYPRGPTLSSQPMMSVHADYNEGMVPGMGMRSTEGGMGGYPGSGVVCMTCGEMRHAGNFCRGMGQECGECTNLRQRGIALGLDHTTITTRVRIDGRSMFQREVAQREAQQHLSHAQQWEQHFDACAMHRTASRMGAVGDLDNSAEGVHGRKPQRGRICLVCQKMKGLTDFRVVAATSHPKDVCGKCARVCDAVDRVGVPWQEVRQAMAQGTLQGLLEAAGCR